MTDAQGWSQCQTPDSLSRRAFLRLVGVAAGAVTLDAVRPTAAQEGWTTLRITAGELEVNGRKAKVYNIQQPDGTSGYVGTKGQRFRVVLQNHTKETLAIHWHGILLPNGQDGVPYVTQAPIQPGEERRYDFPIPSGRWHDDRDEIPGLRGCQLRSPRLQG